MNYLKLITLSILLGCATSSNHTLTVSDFKGKNYIGAVIEVDRNSSTNQAAIRLGYLVPGASANKMGLKTGDLITEINGISVMKLGEPLKKNFAQFIRNYKREDRITFTVKRKKDKELKTLKVSGHVERRAYGKGPKIMAKNDRDLLPSYIRKRNELFSKLNQQVIKNKSAQADYKDLQDTFGLMTNKADRYRRELITYIQRNPFEIANISKDLIKNIHKIENLEVLLSNAKINSVEHFQLGHDPIVFIKTVLQRTYHHLGAAFKDVTRDDRQYVLNHYVSTLKYIDKNIMLKDIKDMDKFKKLSDILMKVKFEYLFTARKIAMNLYNHALKDSLRKFLKGKNKAVIKSPFGNIIIGGSKANTYKDNPDTVAVLIDIGGNDFYLGRFAGANGRRPFSMLIDFAGNDRYQASWDCSFGCGILGLGILVDEKGNDSYRGIQLSQGASFGGVGVLIDKKGDDHYKSLTHSQAYSFYGLSLLEDKKGNDRYNSSLFSQAAAISGGVALLKDYTGNDHYESLGLYRSSYGTKGLHRSFSQGLGLGLRGVMSGGIAILSDEQGKDKFEAGNFSQGAGYYFGWGVFHNGGNENDHYIGSRYTQGATAHYALATFLEDGGNDRYNALHEVSAGMAWDLGVTYFEDTKGNDFYDTQGFTMGAASQNSIAIFVEGKGNDVYKSTKYPANILTNEARDGLSLGYFFDLGGNDSYTKAKNNSKGVVDHVGLWFDGTRFPKKLNLPGN